MAKFVIAGKSNCPYYAKAELIGDQLAKNLPNFKIHKIVVDPNEWDSWLSETCSANDWKHTTSPLVWRELVDRGGKGLLLGGSNEFQEYAKAYYGVTSEAISKELKKISAENETTHREISAEQRETLESIRPLIVTVSNPDTPCFYYMINELLSGSVFGTSDIALRLYGGATCNTAALDGIKMEVEDLASSKLRHIQLVHNGQQAFADADYVLLFDELLPTLESCVTHEYTNPYIALARDIDAFAKATCKVLVSPFASRAEIYALCTVCAKQLKRLDASRQLMGNSLCDEMLAKAALAQRLRVNPAFVRNVLLIGQSLADSYYFDLTCGQVTNFDGAVWARSSTHWLDLVDMVADKDWIRKEYLLQILNREGEIKKKRKQDVLLLFAQSVVNLTRLWWGAVHDNNATDSFYSAVVNINGNYAVNEDIFISVPLQFNQNGSFAVVQKLKMNNQTHSMLEEIIRDSKKRIAQKYKGQSYFEDMVELKLSIPHVIFE